jgi:WD40 repeat protein
MPQDRFDAFISYSRAVDARLTRALQSGLQRFAKPWYRLRLLHVFRDDASLSANPGLWSSIEQALDASSYLILIASPPAAGSKWVAREVEHWRQTKEATRILLALTEGEIVWEESAGDFDWRRTTALPRALAGVFAEEPRWVDLRWARTEEHLSLGDPRFREAVADLSAPIHGRPKDELIGDEVRQHRRTVRIARSAGLVLALLTAAAIAFGVLAVLARNDARAKARVALSRQLAAQSNASVRSGRLDLGLLLAAQSYRSAPTGEARNALVTALLGSPHVKTMLWNEPITGARFTPNGRWLAVLHASRGVGVWNLETQRRVAVHTRAIPTSAVVSADGARLATGFDDGTLELRDLRAGTPPVALRSPSTPRALIPTPTSSTVRAIEFSPDGRLLAWVDGYRLVVWDGHTTRAIPLTGAFRNDWTPAFVHDGRLLAAIGGNPPQITTWQIGGDGPVAASGHTFFTISADDDPRFANLGHALDPADPRLLAIGHYDGTVSLWDVVDRRQVGRLRGGRGLVGQVAFSTDGRLLAGVDTDGIRVWRLSDGRQLPIELPRFGSGFLGFLPTGHLLGAVGGEGAVTIDDLDGLANQLAKALPGASSGDDAVAVSRNGRIIAAYASRYRTGATIDVWDRRSGRRLGRGTFDPHGSTLGVAARDDATLAVWAGTRLELWHPRTNKTERPVDLPGSAIADVVFDAEGGALAALLRPTRPLLWDVDRGAATTTLPISANRIRIAPDGARAAASDGTRTWLLDAGSGGQVGEAVTRGDPVFSSDGRVLAVTASDGAVHVLRAGDAKTIGTVEVGPGFQIDAVAPSGDGTLLAVGGGTFGGGPVGTRRTNDLQLWEVQRNTLLGSQSLANGLPATGSLHLRFLSESGQLVTTGFGGVAVWDVDAHGWASRACALVNRALTRAEWSALVGATTPYDPACTGR